MIDTEIFSLTPGERQENSWRKLVKHMRQKLQDLREKNDSDKLTAEQTTAIRAEIKVYKALLEKDED